MKTLFDEELFAIRMVGGPEDGRVVNVDSIKPYIEVAVQRPPMVMLTEGFTFQRGWRVARYAVHRKINGHYVATYVN